MNIGKLLIEISENCKRMTSEAEKDLHITNAILNYITTDINNASIDTVKVIKSK